MFGSVIKGCNINN